MPDLPRLLMARKLAGESGSGADITLETLNVTQNGTTDAPSGTAYNKVVANVPNSYAAGDEGKVVSNGALVAQTAHAKVTQNGTIDTTLNNIVEVDVSSGGGGSQVVTGTITPASDAGTKAFTHNFNSYDVALFVWADSTNLDAIKALASSTTHRLTKAYGLFGTANASAGIKGFNYTSWRSGSGSTVAGTISTGYTDLNNSAITSNGKFVGGITYNWMAIKYGNNTTVMGD